MYRCEATSLTGFVQQLATVYLRCGYCRAAVGMLPQGKDPAAFDAKQIARYRLDEMTARERMRRKAGGHANIQYLRWRRLFVILATDGEDVTFAAEEGHGARDLREKPLLVGGYSIRISEGHVHVRIAQEECLRLKAYLLGLALKRSADKIGEVFTRLPWQPYAPVRLQLLGVLAAVNERRKKAGQERVPAAAIRRRRRLVRPFEPLEAGTGLKGGRRGS